MAVRYLLYYAFVENLKRFSRRTAHRIHTYTLLYTTVQISRSLANSQRTCICRISGQVKYLNRYLLKYSSR